MFALFRDGCNKIETWSISVMIRHIQHRLHPILNFINMIVMYCVAVPLSKSETPHNADRVKIWSSRTPLVTQKKRKDKKKETTPML